MKTARVILNCFWVAMLIYLAYFVGQRNATKADIETTTQSAILEDSLRFSIYIQGQQDAGIEIMNALLGAQTENIRGLQQGKYRVLCEYPKTVCDSIIGTIERLKRERSQTRFFERYPHLSKSWKGKEKL